MDYVCCPKLSKLQAITFRVSVWLSPASPLLSCFVVIACLFNPIAARVSSLVNGFICGHLLIPYLDKINGLLY